MKKRCIRAFVIVLGAAIVLSSQTTLVRSSDLSAVNAQKALDTAEGFASNSKQSGQTIYHVTNLNDSGAGSLRDAVGQPNRDVVFDVAGTINITTALAFSSNLTVEGQTAPNPGITVYGMNTSLSNVSNVVIRYMRFREGINAPSGKCSLSIDDSHDVIVDHTSIEYGRWDDLHLENDHDITIQYCIIGQGIDPQRFGCLMGGDDRITIHHCLWTDNTNRNPKIKSNVEYADNVIYNWGHIGIQGGHSGGVSSKDIIGNYFISGPNSSSDYMGEFSSTDHVYSAGNYLDINNDGKLNGRLITNEDIQKLTATVLTQRCMQSGLQITSAKDAYKKVVSEAGDSLYRDEEDTRLIDEVKSLGKKGEIIKNDVTREPVGTHNTNDLSAVIATAQNLYDSTAVGTDSGNCTQAVKDALKAAIEQANKELADTDSKQADVDAAASSLRNAITVFNNSIIEKYPVIYKFDFGTQAGLVTTGYTGVTVNPKGGKDLSLGAYTRKTGYGFADLNSTALSNPVQGRNDNTKMIPPDNDYVVAKGIQFLVDVPNGIYNVEFTSAYYAQPSTVKIVAEGIAGSVSNPANQAVKGEVDNVRVSDGQLNIVFPSDNTSRCTQMTIRKVSSDDTPPSSENSSSPSSATANPNTGYQIPLVSIMVLIGLEALAVLLILHRKSAAKKESNKRN